VAFEPRRAFEARSAAEFDACEARHAFKRAKRHDVRSAKRHGVRCPVRSSHRGVRGALRELCDAALEAARLTRGATNLPDEPAGATANAALDACFEFRVLHHVWFLVAGSGWFEFQEISSFE
jgi:hypothetical protein